MEESDVMDDIHHELVTLNLLLASYIRYAGQAALVGTRTTSGELVGTDALDELQKAAHLLLDGVAVAMEDR